jgi:hypothetical protein
MLRFSPSMVRSAALRKNALRGWKINPIELPYSKFKALLRKVAARTVGALFKTIRSFASQLGAQESANYFRHAGYASL